MLEDNVFKLINDHATIKEAFIIDELQSYMDLKDPSNPKWVTPVRVRLQEKKDWEQKVKEAIIKTQKMCCPQITDFETTQEEFKPSVFGDMLLTELELLED